MAESAADRCLCIYCKFGSPVSLVNLIQESDFPQRYKDFSRFGEILPWQMKRTLIIDFLLSRNAKICPFCQVLSHFPAFILHYLLHFWAKSGISLHTFSLCSSKNVVKLGGSSLKSDFTRFRLQHSNRYFSIIKAADWMNQSPAQVQSNTFI